MDPSFQLDGLIYVPLSDTGVMVNNQSSITSWPPFDYPARFFATSDTDRNHQQQHQHQQQREFNISFSPQEQDNQLQNAAVPLPPSLFSSSTSALSFLHLSSSPSTCHPLDPSPAITTSTSILSDNMDTLNPSPCFNINSNSLSPFYMSPHASMSRSSSISSVSYVDPTTLMLNNTPDPSVVSSCYSTPVSRRLSSFSINGATDSEDDQQRALQSLFEQNFSVSSPILVPIDDLDLDVFSAAASTTAIAPPVYSQDFLMPDGSMCRFDGTSLVPAPTAHYPNSLKDVFDRSPMLSAMPYSGVSFSDPTLLMIPPHVSLTDYSDLTHDSSASAFAFMTAATQSTGSTTTTTATTTRLPVKKSHSRKCTLKVASLRHNSADSAYSSSSGSGIKASRFNGSNSSSDNNSNSNNSNYPKYRKEGAGEFKCPFEGCNYHYNLKRELNRHRNVHVFAGKDKYRCMNCNSGLCRLDSVKRHMEAKGKAECLKKGLYQEFRENGELVRIRKCKPSWYEAAAAASRRA
ncbi:hypothetical protein BGZ50_002381 [Haplosporangium sp. Z 11]|nr:hypothetical protein BGZ50_002381 [Haplosporangium sp. Z 11]